MSVESLSINDIVDQMQYYNVEFLHYHITESIFTILAAVIFLVTTIVELMIFYKWQDSNNKTKLFISEVCSVSSMITGCIGLVSLMVGVYNYVIWSKVPVGAAIQQLLDIYR